MLSPDPHLKEEEKKEHTVEKRREGEGRRGKKTKGNMKKESLPMETQNIRLAYSCNYNSMYRRKNQMLQ